MESVFLVEMRQLKRRVRFTSVIDETTSQVTVGSEGGHHLAQSRSVDLTVTMLVPVVQYFWHHPQSHRTLNQYIKYLFIHTAIIHSLRHTSTSVGVFGRTKACQVDVVS